MFWVLIKIATFVASRFRSCDVSCDSKQSSNRKTHYLYRNTQNEVCRDHINQLGYAFGMLPAVDVVDMDHQLYELFEYSGTVEAFKAEHSDGL